MSAIEPPVWMAEETWLIDLLRKLLRRTGPDRTRAVTLTINPKNVPALFRFEEDTNYRWSLIQALATECGIWVVHPGRPGPADEPYLGARVRLAEGAEAILRSWLNMPLVDPWVEAWRAAVAAHESFFLDQGRALLENPVLLGGLAPQQIVSGFARIGQHLECGLSARQLSARCFHGHSKVLDNRLELLDRLYGPIARQIQPRPLLLNAWAPKGFDKILLVENQDSFIGLCEARLPGYALLYSAGFRASAERLVSEHTRFAFLNGSDVERFSRDWQTFPLFFWGDLDYSGMGILRALRRTLPQLAAWRPGYQALLDALVLGCGHSADQADKARQRDPGLTGCAYADQHLLPALRSCNQFIDQEWLYPFPSDAV